METKRTIGIGWFWRTVVRVLAPTDERASILDDLTEDKARLTLAQGHREARRFVRWQVLHSVLPWVGRAVRDRGTNIKRTLNMLHRGFWTDIRLAARRLGQSRGFTVLALVTLTIGIGAVSTVFSLAHALWLKPLPYHEPDRLVWIHAQHVNAGSQASLTSEELNEYRLSSTAFSDVAGFGYGALIARVNDEPVRIVAYRVSPNLFRVLGVRPARGRDFLDTETSGASVVMLSHDIWVQRFRSDPAIVGKTMMVGDEPFDVVGVMPRGFSFPRGLRADVWLPSDLVTADAGRGRVVQAIARLAPGRSINDGNAEVAMRAQSLAQSFPETNTGWTAFVDSAAVTASSSSRLAFQALLGLVALFLLVACTNLAGLLLARNASRRSELAICLSLGAPRWRLARSLLAETTLLAGAGCASGAVLAAYSGRLLSSFLPRNTPGLDQIVLSAPVVVVTVAVAMAAAMFIGLLPALGLRTIRPSEALAGMRTVARGTSRGQIAVVLAEITCAVVLLVGATAMLQSLDGALGRDRGYEPSGLASLNVTLPFTNEAYEDTERRALEFESLVARVNAVPGVQMAAATTGFPGSSLGVIGSTQITAPDSGSVAVAAIHAASADYFETMQIPLRVGRTFGKADTTRGPHVAVVNEQVAARFPAGAIGQRLALSIFGREAVSFEIVGVVGDISLDERVWPRIFVPLTQVSPYWIDLVFRQQPGPPVLPAVRQALRASSRDLLLENESSFQSIIANSLALERTQSLFAGLVGVLSTLVAGIGLYSLMTFLTAQRRREFGVRLALGSQPRQLFQGALAGALRLVIVGLLLGCVVAAFLVRVLGSLVFGLTSVGWDAYFSAFAIVLVVAGLAAWLPARRIMRTDPLIALRSD